MGLGGFWDTAIEPLWLGTARAYNSERRLRHTGRGNAALGRASGRPVTAANLPKLTSI
jgi:hypothetical protein